MTQNKGPEELARRTGFKPLAELTEAKQQSVDDYIAKWYWDKLRQFDTKNYWWKESCVGDGNWISFDVSPFNRIAAPHLG